MSDTTASNPNTEIVGGMFGIPQTVPTHPAQSIPEFLRDESVHLTNGRSGIRVLLDHLGVRRIWLPSYLCPSILQAIDQSRVEVVYYAVNAILGVSTLSWLRDAKPGDLVLVIDYFGFPTDDRIAAEAKARGCWVLEDASQALLTSKKLNATDFILYSPRKFVGIPDGGILAEASGREIPIPTLEPPPDAWWLCGLEAAIRRREFDRYHIENRWFDWYLRSKKVVPIGAYRMSEISWRLLVSAFDYQEIAERRIKNYALLLTELVDVAVFKCLPPGVVPLGFPIRLRNRDAIRNALFERRVYPPVHWDLEGVIADHYTESLDLSKCILTLPCDQRYGECEMKMMIRILREHQAGW